MVKGLYIHIPFCNYICPYCAFSKVLFNENMANQYLEALSAELSRYRSYRFSSIYIGGGTPTSLNNQQLKKLFNIIKPFFADNYFITVETNPDLTNDKIAILKENNVMRVSVGVQTFSKKFQEQIKRKYSYLEIRNLINTLHDYQINDINCDLMYGFNNQTIVDLKEDLELLTSLNVTHISTYCLQIEKMTVFYNQNYRELDQDKTRFLYDYIYQYLKEKGFKRYEVSNFSLENYQSKHNLLYWNDEEYLGVGLGASSYLKPYRLTNTKSITQYLKHQFNDYRELVTNEDDEFYFIMLGFRMDQGFSLSKYNEKFNVDFLKKYQKKIETFLNDGSIVIDGDYISLNENNLFIADYFLRKILFD